MTQRTLKAFYRKINFPGLKRTLGTLYFYTRTPEPQMSNPVFLHNCHWHTRAPMAKSSQVTDYLFRTRKICLTYLRKIQFQAKIQASKIWINSRVTDVYMSGYFYTHPWCTVMVKERSFSIFTGPTLFLHNCPRHARAPMANPVSTQLSPTRQNPNGQPCVFSFLSAFLHRRVSVCDRF